MAKPINKPIRGIRDSIPGGYILGRTGAGNGPPILLPISGFTTPGFVANTTIQVNGPAGGDLSGTYPNPTVAKIQGNAVKTGVPSDKQVLTWVNANTDWEPATPHYIPAGGTVGQVLTKIDGTDYNVDWEAGAGGSNLILGSGAPSAFKAAGTIYSRTDTAGLYSSQPAVPSIVQSASTAGHSTPGSPTLGAAPTAGNLIVIWLGTDSDSHSVIDLTKWTLITNGGATHFGLAAYRYVQAGDAAALPAICTSGTRFWASEAVEINNVSGTFATDLDQFKAAYDLTASPITTTAATTVNPNELGVVGTMQYNATSNASIAAPWTSDIQSHDSANFGSFNISHEAFAAAASSVSATITLSGSDKAFYIVLLFNPLAKWVKLAPLPAGLDSVINMFPLNLTGSKA